MNDSWLMYLSDSLDYLLDPLEPLLITNLLHFDLPALLHYYIQILIYYTPIVHSHYTSHSLSSVPLHFSQLVNVIICLHFHNYFQLLIIIISWVDYTVFSLSYYVASIVFYIYYSFLLFSFYHHYFFIHLIHLYLLFLLLYYSLLFFYIHFQISFIFFY